jgi:hypothetical protein
VAAAGADVAAAAGLAAPVEGAVVGLAGAAVGLAGAAQATSVAARATMVIAIDNFRYNELSFFYFSIQDCGSKPWLPACLYRIVAPDRFSYQGLLLEAAAVEGEALLSFRVYLHS